LLEPINLHARDLALADGGKKGIKNTTGSPECPPNVEAHRVEPEEGGQEEVVHQHGWNEKKQLVIICALRRFIIAVTLLRPGARAFCLVITTLPRARILKNIFLKCFSALSINFANRQQFSFSFAGRNLR
jgi:hypothetical protein